MEYKIEYKVNKDLIAHYLNKDEITVGRSSGHDIQLIDKEVSKHHCKLVKWEESFQLIDLNSFNGFHMSHQNFKHHRIQTDS